MSDAYPSVADNNSLTRFIKVRELAESRNKEKMGKLQDIINRWTVKEKKIKEFELETIAERKYLAEQKKLKQAQIKAKAEKSLRLKEEQSMRDYRTLVMDLA
jgi:hypothetical protein